MRTTNFYSVLQLSGRHQNERYSYYVAMKQIRCWSISSKQQWARRKWLTALVKGILIQSGGEIAFTGFRAPASAAPPVIAALQRSAGAR